jgi:hypothetical protein
MAGAYEWLCLYACDQAQYHILKFEVKVWCISMEEAKLTFGLHSLRGGGRPLMWQLLWLIRPAFLAVFLSHGGWASLAAMQVCDHLVYV